MKAIIHRSYGPPNVLRIVEVNVPKVKENEILIKVHTSTVNRTDCGFRSAEYFITRFFSGLFKPKNGILGCEFAGEVVEIGSKVTKFKVGDKVFGYDDEKWGGYGEFKAINEDKMVETIPEGVSYEGIVASTEGSHYMLHYLRAAKIGKDTSILIHGGTGAIGSSAIQIMSHIGAKITATSPTKHTKLVKSLGAAKVIDWQKTDLSNIEEKFDVIFDAVGKSSWKICKPLLKTNGIYMSTELGDHGQNPILAIWTKLFSKQKVLFPIPKNSNEDIQYLKKLIAEGVFKPLVDRTFRFEDIVKATEYVESGQKIGNVVVTIHKD